MNDRQALERKHEIKVGLTVLVAIAILVFAILTVGQNRGILTDRYKLIVNMSRVNGLQNGALLNSSDPLDIEKLLDEGVDVFAGLKKATQTINEIGEKINTGKGTL